MTFNFDQFRMLAGDRPQQVPITGGPADPYNNVRAPSHLPYNQRFAGGQLQATYTPYDGDLSRYGMGAQHRYWVPGTSAWTTNTSTGTGTGTTTTNHGTEQQQNGGPDGGQNGDALGGNGQARDPSMAAISRDFSALMDMITGVSPTAAALGFGGMGKEQVGPQIPAFGINDAVADEIAQAAQGGGGYGEGYSGGPMGGQTEGGFSNDGVEGRGGFMAEGGHVEGDERHGEDDVHGVSLDGDEFVIRAKESVKIGRDILSRLNAGHYDLSRLRKAVGL